MAISPSRVGRWLLQRPWLLAIVSALVTAVAFPTSGASGVAIVILAGAIAIALARVWGRLPPGAPPRWLGNALAVAIVALAGMILFVDILRADVGWNAGDWSVQHFAVKKLVGSLQDGGGIPHWTHAVSTGESPYETYPLFTHLVGAVAAIATGNEDDIPFVVMAVGIVAHVGVSIGITRLALRVTSWPIAALAGVLSLVEAGRGASGGTNGVLFWALIHSALAQVFILAALVAVLDAIERPRLGASIRIWIWTALACAAHPLSLVTAAGAGVALAITAALATDVPPRRALAAALHLALGVALAAVVWMPLGERLLLYGQHFGNPPHQAGEWLGTLVSGPRPASNVGAVVSAGYVGLVVGFLTRRAAPVFLATMAALFVVGLADLPYVLFDVGPSPGLARLGLGRFESVVRPLVFVGVGQLAAMLVAVAATGNWRRAGVRTALVAGMVGLVALRAGRPYVDDLAERSRIQGQTQLFDSEGFAQVVAWARQRAAEQRPDRFARLLIEGDFHALHLTAETGLPTLSLTAIPDLMLRERIESPSDASLRRFDVRWVLRAGTPPLLGDPDTQQRFGEWYLREVPGWDGRFARVEAGEGAAVVTRLDDERVDVDLTGTDRPALVALGMGFYPRWRALHASGAALPVYALPSEPGGRFHVVAAWLPPGRTTFTPDAALPSDRAGLVPSIAAALVAIAALIVWQRRSWRRVALRSLARVRRAAARRRRVATVAGWIALAVVLPAVGLAADRARADAVELGSGLGAGADVEARPAEGSWETCPYSPTRGLYTCGHFGTVGDSLAAVVNDGAGSWPYVTPAIVARAGPAQYPLEFRIQRRARLAGRYWIGVAGGTARIDVSGEPPLVTAGQVEQTYADRGERTITISGMAPEAGVRIVFVAADTLDPPRPFLVPPPPAPPPSRR